MLTLGVVAGLFTAGEGNFVLVKGECPLTDTIYLEGRQAKIAGVVTVVLGLSLVIFCTVVFPLLLGSPYWWDRWDRE